MKAEQGDLRDNAGEIRLLPESIDDLWHLEHLIFPGDLAFATTFRSVESATDKIRPEKVEKRPVRLGIRVEKVEFSGHGVRLRVPAPSNTAWTVVRTTRSTSRPVMKSPLSGSGDPSISSESIGR